MLLCCCVLVLSWSFFVGVVSCVVCLRLWVVVCVCVVWCSLCDARLVFCVLCGACGVLVVKGCVLWCSLVSLGALRCS